MARETSILGAHRENGLTTVSAAGVRVGLCTSAPGLAAAVMSPLRAAGFAPLVADTTRKLSTLSDSAAIDLALLHWESGAYDVLECCARLRSRAISACLPIIVLSEWTGEHALLKAFELGADDYVRLPVAHRELMLRAARLVERPPRRSFGAFLVHDDIVLSLATHQVLKARKQVTLRPAEFRLLRALMRRPGELLSVQELAGEMRSGHRPTTSKAVAPRMASLRKALAQASPGDRVRTVPGLGYAMD